MPYKIMDLGRIRITFLCVMLPLILTGCAAHYAPGPVKDPYGFLSGVWHGVVWPWALLVNIASWTLALIGVSFFESVQLIGRPNTGFFWYYVGFLLGLGVYGGGAAKQNG